MKVRLKHEWFGPNAHLYSREIPQHMPDEFRDVLPPGAVVLDGPDPVSRDIAPVETLRDHDIERYAAEIVGEVTAKAEEVRTGTRKPRST